MLNGVARRNFGVQQRWCTTAILLPTAGITEAAAVAAVALCPLYTATLPFEGETTDNKLTTNSIRHQPQQQKPHYHHQNTDTAANIGDRQTAAAAATVDAEPTAGDSDWPERRLRCVSANLVASQ